ncbi:hypothetical protein EJ06DRAFT_539330 [Trichodelitschia bisporula]|uniref:Cation/H+ exchanger transmembrane domain-containing protein n=1 Tax=Trichodelitschia bisporula TaxID=703511 RepID=A0A6G1HPI8_9PEZI|nr:hypothetical protein EJ06DRAFT_539330 [Trichodelitschia bisporula]
MSDRGFLTYREPDSSSTSAPIPRLTTKVVQLLVLISFFVLLNVGEWLASKAFRAGLIGQIVVGLVYGRPLANILDIAWQHTFIALGYLGLVLIIVEGSLAVRLDLLKANFVLSVFAACIGILAPIGLSFLALYLGFGYGAVETFICGAALSSTSIGTTFVVLGQASSAVAFADTKVGSVLISAAVFDDVAGLAMASVIEQLSDDAGRLGWLIGRPILASVLMAALTPLLTKFAFAPLFRHLEPPRGHWANMSLMVGVLCAFLAIAAYAGTSLLFGAFLAGTFLAYLENEPGRFMKTYAKYVLDVQQYLMQPIFFASIGFAIPFKSLWSGRAVWRGVVYALLMVIGKVLVGTVIPLWDVLRHKGTLRERTSGTLWPSVLLGGAMVARGEIGLLIIQIGFNKTAYLSQDALITAIWAILLNTVIGPVAVGFLVKYKAQEIGTSQWGIQKHGSGEQSEVSVNASNVEAGNG